MAVRAKLLRYAASIDADGRLCAEDRGPIELPADWQAEHLLLTALIRCSLTSLDYHARRAGSSAAGTGKASGEITKRESDGRYAFVEIRVNLEVTLDPQPDAVEELLAKAERDCFVGASLTATPRYRWRVNGRAVSARAAPS
jgi:organic hydroperoxide reductase OsmC/OhrA